MTNEHDPSIDVAGLLTIDVASELRKLSQAQLQGPWQVPAELVRRCIRTGAQQVRVQTQRHGVRITDDGGGIDPELLRWTAVLLDERRPNEQRHTALTHLEAAGELVLLALAGLQDRRVRIETVCCGHRATLDIQRAKSPRFESRGDVTGSGTTVELRSAALDRRQLVQWLRSSARFASTDVRIDGKPVAAGFANALVQGSLRPPLRGRLAIPPEGDTAHVWLLEHGLVTGHVTVPEAPCLEAAVEMGSEVADLSSARLRDAIAPHVPALVDQAVGLMVALAERPLPESMRARAARLILQAARKKLRLSDVVRVPLFRTVDASGPGRIDLLTLRRIGQQGSDGMRVLAALYPSQKPEHFALGTVPVLVADAVERSRLAELMHVRFRPPDPRDASSGLRSAWRRKLDALRRGVARIASWIRHPVRTPPVPEHELQPHERKFVELLRTHLRQGAPTELCGARLCRGSGPIRRNAGARELLLPRDNPAVLAAMRAVTHDPAWIYPATLALLEGRSLPAAGTRAQWMSALGC